VLCPLRKFNFNFVSSVQYDWCQPAEAFCVIFEFRPKTVILSTHAPVPNTRTLYLVPGIMVMNRENHESR